LKSEYADAWDYNNPKDSLFSNKELSHMSAYLGTVSILFPLLRFSKQNAEWYRMGPEK